MDEWSTMIRFKHDCENCVWLGTYSNPSSPDKKYLELYCCQNKEKNRLEAIIGRFGNGPNEYISYDSPEGFADPSILLSKKWYKEALRRASNRNLYHGKL